METEMVESVDVARMATKPWNLSEEWFDRLNMPEDLRRHYNHLDEAERRALEELRHLAEHYAWYGLLQEGRTVDSLLAHTAEKFDEHWLREGKGRAVDFKNTLKVFKRCAAYVDWAREYPDGLKILDLTLPYFGRYWESAAYGLGFFRIEITVSRPRFGKQGDMKWEAAKIEILDLQVDKSLFEKPPVEFLENFDKYLPQKIERRMHTFRYNPQGYEWDSPLGFVFKIGEYCLETLHGNPHNEGKSLFQKNPSGGQFLPDWIEMWVENPTVDQFQEFLDAIAKSYFSWRVPREDWQIQFDVQPNLRSVTSSCVLIQRGPFDGCGLIYREPKR